MSGPSFLGQALEAARAAGAVRVEGFHRRSQTRQLELGPGPAFTEAERTEEGTALRVWLALDPEEEAGFAAATPGEEPMRLGSDAVAAARRRPGRARSRGATRIRKGSRVAREGSPRRPGGGRDDGSRAGPGEASSFAGSPGENGPLPKGPEHPDVPIFDPEILRASRFEFRRRLDLLLARAQVARRPGLPPAARAVLRVAVVESMLVRPDGSTTKARATLASTSLRFPTAFGLGQLEIVSRRLADLDPAALVPLMAAYPSTTETLPWLELIAAEGGDIDVVLAPPVGAGLMARLARRVVAQGEPFVWESPAVLWDDPLQPWAPGSMPVDGEGNPHGRRLLAGPADKLAGAGTPIFSPVRFSFREPPRPAPANLILAGLPGGARPQGESIQLLEEVAWDNGALIARGVRRHADENPAPVMVRLAVPAERIMTGAARGGASIGFLPATAYCSVPEIVLPGIRIR
jgi:hypothetical protein